MNKSNIKSKDIIFILGNKDYKIKYSSVDNQVTYDYIQKLNILDNLHIDLPFQYIADDYYIKIDKCIISNQRYYIITIRLKKGECDNCIKALIDRATGLYNRNYLEEVRIEDSVPRIQDFFLILIDIDNLKKINDNYGHLEGDKAIKIVGQSIISSIRKEDIGIRYGGDEFIVILFKQNIKAVNKVVERMKKEIIRRNIEENISIKVSTGIAYGDCFSSLDGIIKMADKKLYKEKKMKKEQEYSN